MKKAWRLQYTIDAHSSDISKMLRLLCKNGYLVASGIGRGTHYKLNEAYASTLANAPVNATPNAKAKDKPTDDKPKVNNMTDNSITLTFKAEDKPKDKLKDKLKDKPKDKADTGSVRNKKVVISELIRFCSVWKKSSDMARHVGKTPTYLSRSIIPEMIERGLLIREYPDNPHHPAQRYRTKPKSGSNKDS